MIPIRDHNPSGSTPVVTRLIIAANIVVFIYMLAMTPESVDNFVARYGLIPTQVLDGHQLFTFATSLFVHGGIGHIVGNMIFLNIFGDNLEHRLGHFKYLLYYLACGIAGSIAQIAVDPLSSVPIIGASGAIAGLMGGYLMLYPMNPIEVLFDLGLFYQRTMVPAFTMIIYWFVAQLFSGAGSLVATANQGGVAYFAHIGGFVAGAYLSKRSTASVGSREQLA